MSIYNFHTQEPAITAPADGDMFLMYDASPSRTARATVSTIRSTLGAGLVDSTGTTLDVTAAAHGGRTILINRAAGQVITLPAATGSGTIYRFIVAATTAGTTTIKVNGTPGTDTMIGTAILFQDSGDAMVGFAAGATADTITLYVSGSTTGGIAGARLTIQDIATALWHVDYVSDAAGSEATPFSATVP